MLSLFEKALPHNENGDTTPEKFALRATRYIGSPISLILHTCFFVGIFGLQWAGFAFEQLLLILTTIVSLEAIYLSIFIQMTVNHQAKKIREVGEDVEEISKDIDDIQEDVEDISKDVDDIQEDVEDISKDVDDIQEDVEEISKDVDDIQGDAKEISADVEGLQEHIESIKENVEDLSDELGKDDADEATDQAKIHRIEQTLQELILEIRSFTKTTER